MMMSLLDRMATMILILAVFLLPLAIVRGDDPPVNECDNRCQEKQVYINEKLNACFRTDDRSCDMCTSGLCVTITGPTYPYCIPKGTTILRGYNSSCQLLCKLNVNSRAEATPPTSDPLFPAVTARFTCSPTNDPGSD